MAVTVGGTSITFNDGTTQTTAASAPSTAFGAVGTYALLMNASNTNNVNVDVTVAGSTLRYNHTGNTGAIPNNTLVSGTVYRDNNSTYPGGGTAPSGTWRKMSSGRTYLAEVVCCGTRTNYFWFSALYVRIS